MWKGFEADFERAMATAPVEARPAAVAAARSERPPANMELRASEALANTITPELLREALTTVLQTYAAGDPAGPSAVVALIRERLAAAGRAWAAAEQGAAARRAAAEERARNNAEEEHLGRLAPGPRAWLRARDTRRKYPLETPRTLVQAPPLAAGAKGAAAVGSLGCPHCWSPLQAELAVEPASSLPTLHTQARTDGQRKEAADAASLRCGQRCAQAEQAGGCKWWPGSPPWPRKAGQGLVDGWTSLPVQDVGGI